MKEGEVGVGTQRNVGSKDVVGSGLGYPWIGCKTDGRRIKKVGMRL